MTRREILNKIRVLEQQLQLIQMYPEAFEEYYGSKKNVTRRIDEILDEIMILRRLLKKKNS